VSGLHTFHAAAFVENFNLRELSAAFTEGKRTPHELAFRTHGGGSVYFYPFGAAVFRNLGPSEREQQLERLRQARPGLSDVQAFSEQFSVRVVPGARPDMDNGVLVLDELTPQREGVVALTIAQSAAMEYYERIIDQMFGQTDKLVDKLEKFGTMPLNTRPLHRFIGQAIGTRNEVLSILHLLDKPDAAWDDPAVEHIYEELRAEFDLVDRYQALELKLRSVQEALGLVVDVARDRRLVLLEGSIVFLFVLDILLMFVWRH
jgi:uncharacterized Rmd1/YagE family protein